MSQPSSTRRRCVPIQGVGRGVYRPRSRGLALVEVLIATAVLAFIATLIYGALSNMRTSRQAIARITDRYREGRLAMSRMTRELQSAFLSLHKPLDPSLLVQQTIFVGHPSSPGDRLDFTSFAHRRLDANSAESDQAEISYFVMEDPEQPGVYDLVRRVDPVLDLEPDGGGRVDVLATDVDLFKLEYLDATTGLWQEEWDSTQATGQLDRLPPQVRILLVLNGGARRGSDRAREPIKLSTAVVLPMYNPLRFATQ